jgi:hypothetical protein
MLMGSFGSEATTEHPMLLKYVTQIWISQQVWSLVSNMDSSFATEVGVWDQTCCWTCVLNLPLVEFKVDVFHFNVLIISSLLNAQCTFELLKVCSPFRILARSHICLMYPEIPYITNAFTFVVPETMYDNDPNTINDIAGHWWDCIAKTTHCMRC